MLEYCFYKIYIIIMRNSVVIYHKHPSASTSKVGSVNTLPYLQKFPSFKNLSAIAQGQKPIFVFEIDHVLNAIPIQTIQDNRKCILKNHAEHTYNCIFSLLSQIELTPHEIEGVLNFILPYFANHIELYNKMQITPLFIINKLLEHNTFCNKVVKAFEMEQYFTDAIKGYEKVSTALMVLFLADYDTKIFKLESDFRLAKGAKQTLKKADKLGTIVLLTNNSIDDIREQLHMIFSAINSKKEIKVMSSTKKENVHIAAKELIDLTKNGGKLSIIGSTVMLNLVKKIDEKNFPVTGLLFQREDTEKVKDEEPNYSYKLPIIKTKNMKRLRQMMGALN